MTDMQAPPMAAPVPEAPDPVYEAGEAILHALTTCARKVAGEGSAAEAKDYAASALSLAQALITLDPTRLAGGDTPEAREASVPKPPPTSDGDRDGRIGS